MSSFRYCTVLLCLIFFLSLTEHLSSLDMFKVANAKIPRWVSFDSLDRQELQYQHQKWILTTLIAHFYTVQCLIDYLTIFFRCCNNDAVTSWRQPILISKATMKWTNAKIFKGPYCISWVVETSCLGFPFLSEKSSGKWWYDGRQNKRQLNNIFLRL